MTRMVNCPVLKREAEGLEAPPHPGELGQRIYDTVSVEAWKQWLERLVPIINENSINTADPESLELIEEHMKGFLFSEGSKGDLPAGFTPNSKK